MLWYISKCYIYIYVLWNKKHALKKLFTYSYSSGFVVDLKLHFANVTFYHNSNYGSRFSMISEGSKRDQVAQNNLSGVL